MCEGGFAVGVWECAFDWWVKLFLQVLKQITLDPALQKLLLPKREVESDAALTALLLPDTGFALLWELVLEKYVQLSTAAFVTTIVSLQKLNHGCGQWKMDVLQK